MTKEIIFSDATKLAELIRTKEVSPVEVVQAHLDRIAAVNPKINAIVTLADGALKAAKAAEAAVLAGDEIGPLHGVPFTVKDSIDTADVATQRGSPIFKGRVPDVDATSVARMIARMESYPSTLPPLRWSHAEWHDEPFRIKIRILIYRQSYYY